MIVAPNYSEALPLLVNIVQICESASRLDGTWLELSLEGYKGARYDILSQRKRGASAFENNMAGLWNDPHGDSKSDDCFLTATSLQVIRLKHDCRM